MAQLDHLMYAVPDLESGMQHIHELTGVAPAMGGSHPGAGTRNALLSFGNDQYLEIIAPDPAQQLSGTTGELLAQHARCGIRAWAVASHDLVAVQQIAQEQKLASRDVIDMARTTPDGVALAWQLLFLRDRQWPFFIDWQNSPHPAQSAPGGCELLEFMVTVPEPDSYRKFMTRLGISVTVAAGALGFTATLDTPNGPITLPTW